MHAHAHRAPARPRPATSLARGPAGRRPPTSPAPLPPPRARPASGGQAPRPPSGGGTRSSLPLLAATPPYAFAPYREETAAGAEAEAERETVSIPAYAPSTAAPLALELPRAVESPVDDPRLANPLARLERMSTGWMGVILELEGVLIPDATPLHDAAWQEVAAAEGRPLPHRAALARAAGMKDEQVVAEAFAWARAPPEVRRLARLKAAAFDRLAAAVAAAAAPAAPGAAPLPTPAHPSPLTAPAPGAAHFLSVLASHGIPAALATAAPLDRVSSTLASPSLPPFAAVVTGDDVARGRPDPEPFLVAAAALGRPPARCVLVGSSNAAVEAAREAGMACIAVAGGGDEGGAAAAAVAAACAAGTAPVAPPRGPPPRYELAAADLVVSGLGDLTLSDLKSLFRYEEPVEGEGVSGSGSGNSSSSAAPASSLAAVGVVDDDEDDAPLFRSTSLDDELAAANAASSGASSSSPAFGGADGDLDDVLLPPWVDRREWEREQRPGARARD